MRSMMEYILICYLSNARGSDYEWMDESERYVTSLSSFSCNCVSGYSSCRIRSYVTSRKKSPAYV